MPTAAPVKEDIKHKPAETIHEYITPLVTVGEPGLIWITRGNRINGLIPCMVNEEQAGILTVTIFPKNGMPYAKTGVHYVGDPYLKSHPDALQRSGAWDFCDSLKSQGIVEKRIKTALIAQEAKRQAKLAELEAATRKQS